MNKKIIIKPIKIELIHRQNSVCQPATAWLAVSAGLGESKTCKLTKVTRHDVRGLCRFCINHRLLDVERFKLGAMAKTAMEARFQSLEYALSELQPRIVNDSPDYEEDLKGWRLAIVSSDEDFLATIKKSLATPETDFGYVHASNRDPVRTLKNFASVQTALVSETDGKTISTGTNFDIHLN